MGESHTGAWLHEGVFGVNEGFLSLENPRLPEENEEVIGYTLRIPKSQHQELSDLVDFLNARDKVRGKKRKKKWSMAGLFEKYIDKGLDADWQLELSERPIGKADRDAKTARQLERDRAETAGTAAAAGSKKRKQR